MPCGSEHMKKLDSMMDALFAPKQDQAVMGTPPVKEKCAPFSDKTKKDTQMEPGNLGKKNAS